MSRVFLVEKQNFNSQKECTNYVQEILGDMGVTKSVKNENPHNYSFLIELLKRHPTCEKKTEGMCDISICVNPRNGVGYQLNIEKIDGTTDSISWVDCVSGKPKAEKTKFNSALRESVSDQIKDFKSSNDTSLCEMCDHRIVGVCEADHIIYFDKLVEMFISQNPTISMPKKYGKKTPCNSTMFLEEDLNIGELFSEFHRVNATLRIVCLTCNRTRDKPKPNSR